MKIAKRQILFIVLLTREQFMFCLWNFCISPKRYSAFASLPSQSTIYRACQYQLPTFSNITGGLQFTRASGHWVVLINAPPPPSGWIIRDEEIGRLNMHMCYPLRPSAIRYGISAQTVVVTSAFQRNLFVIFFFVHLVAKLARSMWHLSRYAIIWCVSYTDRSFRSLFQGRSGTLSSVFILVHCNASLKTLNKKLIHQVQAEHILSIMKLIWS